MATPLAKKTKARAFQLSMKMLFAKRPVLSTTLRQSTKEDQADKGESFQCEVSRYEKQAHSLKVFANAKNPVTEAGFRNSEYECGWCS